MIRGHEKITAAHRDRSGYVYVRQSSPHQVRQNLESQERQYELRELIVSLGWKLEDVVILDEDLGQSASGLSGRAGFARLRDEVSNGRVGLIMSLESSRLARNNREWYQLLDLCAVCGSLVGEPSGVYDPSDYEDRLHLGLKGILSEAELHILRTRLTAGIRHKAEKGELALTPPTGLTFDESANIVLDPDDRVQQIFRTLFEKFVELGSAYKVFRWMMEDGLQMPRRVGSTLFSNVVWRAPTYQAVRDVLKNPRYAGTFVYGRTETFMRVEDGEPRRRFRQLPIAEWKVVIPDAHPGYIPWEQFLRNREKMSENRSRPSGSVGAPGRGSALAQGLVRCGKCGAKMYVHYVTNRRNGRVYRFVRYKCTRAGLEASLKPCQSVSGNLLDRTVREAFLEALKPDQLDVSVEALKRLEENAQAGERHWQLKLEQLRHEADRAERQHNQVEPENRLVARNLEQKWEQCLAELKRAEDDYDRWKQQRRASWDPDRIDELRALVKDTRTLWNAESTANEDRKELLRLLIETVWVWGHGAERRIDVQILWKGGSRTNHQAAWSPPGTSPLKEEVVSRMREFSSEGFVDSEIARRLNQEGHVRCDGGSFLAQNVMSMRKKYGIQKGQPPHEPDVYNARQAARKLGVAIETLLNCVAEGVIEGTRSPYHGRTWRIKIPAAEEAKLKERLHGDRNGEKERTIRDAAESLNVPTWQIENWIKQGVLNGRLVYAGRRKQWVIPAEELRARKDDQLLRTRIHENR